ncbi:MAG: TIGR02186 family protein, partial [Thermodesulfobacteriota bacterium]
QFEVENLPHIFKVHSSKPLAQMLRPELIRKYGLSYEALEERMELKLLKGEPEPDDREVMFDGFIRLKEKENLYKIAENRIQITKGRLFDHYFTFPDKAKEGDYVIESFTVKNGEVIGSSTDIVKVRKVGLTAWLYRLSQTQGVLYGIMAVVIALAAGLLVGIIFKGGGH